MISSLRSRWTANLSQFERHLLAMPDEGVRSSRSPNSMRACVLVSLLLVGCNSAHDMVETRSYIHPDELSGTWTVTAVGTDHGHLTYEDPNRDHTYVLGIECEQSGRSITLLYYDRLPDDFHVTVGDQLRVRARKGAELEGWPGGGFWIHDLVLSAP